MSLKEQWIAALRSGRYKQGKDVLRNRHEEFCCLGVLADVCGAGWYESPDYQYRSYSLIKPQGTMISPSDLIYLGPGEELDQNVPWLDSDKDIAHILAGMNDDGESFLAIADWIENNLDDNLLPIEPA